MSTSIVLLITKLNTLHNGAILKWTLWKKSGILAKIVKKLLILNSFTFKIKKFRLDKKQLVYNEKNLHFLEYIYYKT